MLHIIFVLLLERNVEIHNINLMVLCYKYILRLDIPMYNIFVMEVGDALHDLPEELLSKLLGIVAFGLLSNLIEDLLAFDVVHNKMNLFGKLVEKVFCGFDNIPMNQIVGYLKLLRMRHPLLLIGLTCHLHR